MLILFFFSSTEVPVEIVRPPTDVFEPPGSDIVFEAELNKDRVEVRWMRNNMIIVQGDKYQMISEGKVHRLQICEIRPRDQGEYKIVAKDKDARAKLELAGMIVCINAFVFFILENIFSHLLYFSSQLCQRSRPQIRTS